MAEDIIDVTWTDEPVSTEKLGQMAENTRKLRNMLPKALFKSGGINKDTGLKIMAGSSVALPSNNRGQTNDILFGNFFSVGCNPIVVVQTYSEIQKILHVGVHGLGNSPAPTNVGASVYLYYDGPSGAAGSVDYPVQIAWIALGW